MDLRTYLFINRMRIDHTAEKLGLAPQYLSLVSNKKKKPSIQLAIKLIELGCGEITPKDIYPELFEAYEKALKDKKETKNTNLR
jgi:DNA-binding XRE family transcriptional regulator